MRAGPLAPAGPVRARGPLGSMFFPWCCGSGKEGIFRWRRPSDRRAEPSLVDCLEQLSALLALPQIPGEDGPQGFRMLEELHRLLRDVHIQVERALSQRSANGDGGSIGSACGDFDSLCMRCGQVPAALCMTCAQKDTGSMVSALPAAGALRAGGCLDSVSTSADTTHRQRDGRRCGWGGQGMRNPCRLRPHRPRLRAPPDAVKQPLALTLASAPEAKGAKVTEPQVFYIGDDEAWRCDDPHDTLPLVTGVAWKSEPGLPVPASSSQAGTMKRGAAPALPPTLWGSQDLRAEALEDCNPVERAQLVAQLRRQLHSLSEHSRHLLTVPLSAQATQRGSSSTGGTFREFLHACTSEDMVLIPPSCLEARRRSPEAPPIEVGLSDNGICNGMMGHRGPEDTIAVKVRAGDDANALMQLPPVPLTRHDEDEECECERYAVSRQKDGRLIWSPEPLPAG